LAKPLSTTTWATDATITTSPDATENGATPVVDPGAGYRGQGFVPGLPFVGTYVNYVLNLLCQWIVYLNGITTDAQFLASLFAWTGTHTFTPSTAATNGITATGNTTGAGGRFTGGGSGHGVHGTSAGSHGGVFSTSASGYYGVNCIGWGPGHGCVGTGGATGAGSVGIGGATSGAGILGLGDGGAVPIMGKQGVHGVGGTDNPGVVGQGGVGSNGTGGEFTGGSAAPGVIGQGGSGAAGGEFTGGSNGHGVEGTGVGSGAGGVFEGGTSNHAVRISSGASDYCHIVMTNGVSAAPSAAADGCIWFASDGIYLRADGVTYAFKATGIWIGGVQKVVYP